MANVALGCQDLVKAFGGVTVLKSVALCLEEGSVTALVGESGAGKPTMMKIPSGQLRSDRCQVLIGGLLLANADAHFAHRQGVAIVPGRDRLDSRVSSTGRRASRTSWPSIPT